MNFLDNGAGMRVPGEVKATGDALLAQGCLVLSMMKKRGRFPRLEKTSAVLLVALTTATFRLPAQSQKLTLSRSKLKTTRTVRVPIDSIYDLKHKTVFCAAWGVFLH